MNVLKTLNEDRFNDILLLTDRIDIFTPCRLELVVEDVQTKNMNKYKPLRCILINKENRVILNNVQSVSINVPRLKSYNHQQEVFTTAYGCKMCTIDLISPLTEQKLNELNQKFNSVYNINNFTF